MTAPTITIPLRYAVYEVWPDTRTVRTRFHDGRSACGTRDPADPQNLAEAESQGYHHAAEPVWRSLVEHELLHSVVPEALFDRWSTVLRTESGGDFYPSWQRYEEEALCLAYQTFFNTRVMPPVLLRYGNDNLDRLRRAWFDYSRPLRVLWPADPPRTLAVTPGAVLV